MAVNKKAAKLQEEMNAKISELTTRLTTIASDPSKRGELSKIQQQMTDVALDYSKRIQMSYLEDMQGTTNEKNEMKELMSSQMDETQKLNKRTQALYQEITAARLRGTVHSVSLLPSSLPLPSIAFSTVSRRRYIHA